MSTENYLKVKQDKKEEETKLIKLALAGDEDAFATLYNRHYGQVFAFCSKLLHGKYDIDDAVQQVFLEAWRSMGRFEGRSLFSTWLTKIAIHTCLSFHRKSGRMVLCGNDDTHNYEQATTLLWGDAAKIPEEEVFLTEKKALVNKLLDRMTPKKKLVFILSDMQGMSAPEISAILKIPDATVRTRLFHARREFSLWVQRNSSYRDVLDARCYR